MMSFQKEMEHRTKPAKIAPDLLLANFLFSGIFIAQAQSPAREVNRIVGGTALLSVTVPRDLHVLDDVRWKYAPAAPARVRLGDSKGRIFEPYAGSYTNYSQLIQRLDMYDEATLRVRNLTKGDSGRYRADVQFKDGYASVEEFQLNLYDPVPEPQIKMNSSTRTSDGCNFTLDCQPSDAIGTLDLNITWFQENLIERTHVRISNKNLIHVSLKNYSSLSAVSTYICYIRNPVDEKNTSISLDCLQHSDRNRHLTMYLCISITVIFLFCGAYFCWKKKKKRKDKGSTTDDKGRYCPASHEEITEYSSSIRRSPDGADEVNSQLEDEETTTTGNQTEHSIQQTPIYPDNVPS